MTNREQAAILRKAAEVNRAVVAEAATDPWELLQVTHRDYLIDLAESQEAGAQALDAGSGQGWQPIETVPAGVTRVILFWPAHTLDDDGNLSSGRIPANDVVAVGYRVGGQQWEGGPEIEATWPSSDDGWELGDPTHWLPLPAPPGDHP